MEKRIAIAQVDGGRLDSICLFALIRSSQQGKRYPWNTTIMKCNDGDGYHILYINIFILWPLKPLRHKIKLIIFILHLERQDNNFNRAKFYLGTVPSTYIGIYRYHFI